MINVGQQVTWKNKAAGRVTTRTGTVFALVPAGQDADKLLPDDVKAYHMKYVSSVSMKDRVLVAVPAGEVMHYYCPPQSVFEEQNGREIPVTSDEVLKYYKRHHAACEKWEHGNPVAAWIDKDGNVCIRYQSGKWWHYAEDICW